MDLEAMQLLNLSPIPELSEVELSTMLDHLSGLSDINGDLTDRNVEDIIKEAEDLLDRSINSKISESKGIKGNSELEEETCNGKMSQDVSFLKESEVCSNRESNSDEMKHQSNTVNDAVTILNTSNEDDSKHFNTPIENTPTKVYSPCSGMNHIKSTIDSLKEFSSLVEKQLSSQSENSSPKHNKKAKQTEYENKQVTIIDTSSNEKLVSTRQVPNDSKVKSEDLTVKKTGTLDKSVKLLNCFERLYQVRPVRLSVTKKAKVIDKATKSVTAKKLNKDIKITKKNTRQGKTVLERVANQEAKNLKTCHAPTFLDKDDLLYLNKGSLKYYLPINNNFSQAQATENNSVDEHLTHYYLDNDTERNDCRQVQSRIDEKLILKVLEEMEEIKAQVRNSGVATSNPEKRDDTAAIQQDTTGEVRFIPGNSGIKRLEQQFATLKEKYDRQMEKLEAENHRLREALNSQEKLSPPQNQEGSKSPPSPKKASRNVSVENCKAPKNSPCSSVEINTEVATVRDAFAQTEEEPKSARREVGTDAEEILTEGRKTENKENLAGKRKQGGKCCKPFTDLSQSMRQKKIVEHESQLLATLRGLQAEVTAKDKENRKLRNEMETMRKQMKKVTVCKESCKKCHAGTQTIALGPIMQKPYNPEDYEVPEEFERENEDLRSRIKALEEDFELLKEKRITDLQALHQVHEEEMAKLVSKLETQSALTRHLHSLLRFQLPASEESFFSALSQGTGDDEDDYEDFSRPQTSILQKFVSFPLPHSEPRKATKVRCITQTSEIDMSLMPASSSQQLFQIGSDSPSQSRANLHLLRGTLLRRLEAVKEAIEAGANVNASVDGQTALMLATEIGDHRLVAYLLTVPDVNPDYANDFGQTPLLVAVRNSFVEIVKLLLNHNADVNFPDHMGRTPLYFALFQMRPHLVKLLLAYGAEAEQEDCFGEKPVYTCAVKKPNLECLVTLLKMGANVNYINFTGIPLLSRVILNGTDIKVVVALVQYGASVNAPDIISKKTPLHFSCLQDNVRIVRFLVTHGADVNIKTTYNFTPLDEAIFQRNMEVAEYLRDVMKLNKKKSAYIRPIRAISNFI